jgi:hypothetical protein
MIRMRDGDAVSGVIGADLRGKVAVIAGGREKPMTSSGTFRKYAELPQRRGEPTYRPSCSGIVLARGAVPRPPQELFLSKRECPHRHLTLLSRISERAILSSMASAVSSPWE